jgi:hypothetical protein
MSECSICLDELKHNTLIQPCTHSNLHTFHLECIQSLVKNNFNNCPICKSLLKNEYLNKSNIISPENHPRNHYFWKSFQYSFDEETDIYYELHTDNLSEDEELKLYKTYDQLSKKVPSSDFDLHMYFRSSIFRRLLMIKTKESLKRLTELSKNIAYYPHDLDIVLSYRKGYTDIAINLINNQRYNPLYSDHTMMTLELNDNPEVYQKYLKKYNMCCKYYQ